MPKQGYVMPEEYKRRRSDGMRCALQDPLLRQKWSDVKKGHRHTEEAKQSIRESKLGAKNPQFGKIPKSAFKLGHTPWNKGLKKYDHPSLVAISESRAGDREHNPFFRRGSNSLAWKRGRLGRPSYLRQRLLAQDYIAREQWRRAVFERDNYICQSCGAIVTLEAHHIIPILVALELILDLSNGKTLCHNCHNKLPKGKLLRRIYGMD